MRECHIVSFLIVRILLFNEPNRNRKQHRQQQSRECEYVGAFVAVVALAEFGDGGEGVAFHVVSFVSFGLWFRLADVRVMCGGETLRLHFRLG